MLLFVFAVALCALAALSGAVIAQPVLEAHGAPAALVPFVAVALFVGLLFVPVALSGDWLWMNGQRRSGPPRLQMLARLAMMTGLLGLVGPLVFTDRPLGEIVTGVRTLTSSWTSKPEVVAQVVPPQPSIRPTPADVEFPTAPLPDEKTEPARVMPVIEAQPLKVIDAPLIPELPKAEPGTFFVYEWQDAEGTVHWSNVFEEIPPAAKILKATVMKPVEPKVMPQWVPPSPVPAARTANNFFNDPMLPSYAETHWRSRFKQIHTRIRDQERKIEAKDRELWEAPVLANRHALEQELKTLKSQLDDLKQEDSELEREASYRAVPREWRN